jgi:hypothetical protein
VDDNNEDSSSGFLGININDSSGMIMKNLFARRAQWIYCSKSV